MRIFGKGYKKISNYWAVGKTKWGVQEVTRGNIGNPVQYNCNKYFVSYSRYPGPDMKKFHWDDYGFMTFDKTGKITEHVMKSGKGHQIGTRVYNGNDHGKMYNAKYGDNLLVGYFTGSS